MGLWAPMRRQLKWFDFFRRKEKLMRDVGVQSKILVRISVYRYRKVKIVLVIPFDGLDGGDATIERLVKRRGAAFGMETDTPAAFENQTLELDEIKFRVVN